MTLAKRIARAMDTNKRFGEDGVIVPNRYVLHLSPTDYQAFEAYHGSLEEDLAHEVLTRARREGYRLMARPRVTLQPDGLVPRGEVRVAAAVADADAPVRRRREVPPDATSVYARRSRGSGASRRRSGLPRGPDRWGRRRPVRPRRRADRDRARRRQRRDPR